MKFIRIDIGTRILPQELSSDFLILFWETKHMHDSCETSEYEALTQSEYLSQLAEVH